MQSRQIASSKDAIFSMPGSGYCQNTNKVAGPAIRAKEKKMFFAQNLYDLRECTGFVSGTDLHSVFRDLLGEPSPSGKGKISWQSLKALPVAETIRELIKSESAFLDAVREYTGALPSPRTLQLGDLFRDGLGK